MLLKYFKRLISFLINIGREREDISWKEVNGMMREDKSEK